MIWIKDKYWSTFLIIEIIKFLYYRNIISKILISIFVTKNISTQIKTRRFKNYHTVLNDIRFLVQMYNEKYIEYLIERKIMEKVLWVND